MSISATSSSKTTSTACMCRCRPVSKRTESRMKIRHFGFAVVLTLWGAALSVGMAHAADDTLYQDMGGKDALAKIASDTTDNFLADDRIKATFDNTNMDRFRKLLGEQFCVVAGGPWAYTGRNMTDTHKG